jgi:hypothetical protein
MSMLVFCVLTPCGLVGRYEHFGESNFSPEDGDSMFLRNVGVYLQIHMALLPRRPTMTNSLPFKLCFIYSRCCNFQIPVKIMFAAQLSMDAKRTKFCRNVLIGYRGRTRLPTAKPSQNVIHYTNFFPRKRNLLYNVANYSKVSSGSQPCELRYYRHSVIYIK